MPVLPGRAGHPGRSTPSGCGAHRDHFAVGEFWRFWVVHLWVEDFLELFTTIMVAYIFVLLGVVRRRCAAVIYFDAILYSVGGVVGTMHHFYFSGGPAEHMALGRSSRRRRSSRSPS